MSSSNTGAAGLIPGPGEPGPACLLAKKPEEKQQGQYCKKFSQDFKNGSHQGIPGGPVIKNPPCNVGNLGSIPGLGSALMPGATKPLCHNC